jgi:4-cresol dehydrogenase (hydroxylating) cytochrome subunit
MMPASLHCIPPEEEHMKKMRVFRMSLTISALIAAGGAAADGSGKWISGQEAYDKVCGFCHEKGIGPAIKGQNKSPDLVKHVVRFGNRAMPAFRHTEIDDATLAGIIEFIK